MLNTSTLPHIQIHTSQQLWKGACNKNLGNSFLLIWRIGEEEKLLNVSRSLWSAGGAFVRA